VSSRLTANGADAPDGPVHHVATWRAAQFVIGMRSGDHPKLDSSFENACAHYERRLYGDPSVPGPTQASIHRVLNTCLHLGFRADLADRAEVESRKFFVSNDQQWCESHPLRQALSYCQFN
jgi:hypothetical protein